GERLTRAMTKADMDRSELATLTGYSEAQIVRGVRTRAALSDRADKAVPCARRDAGVAALLGVSRPLIALLLRTVEDPKHLIPNDGGKHANLQIGLCMR